MNLRETAKSALLFVSFWTLLFLSCLFSTSGCASQAHDTGVKWYNPTTWVSGAEARSADRAHAEAADANVQRAAAQDQAAHAAHLEFLKASLALSGTPSAADLELARRCLRNGLGLLDQFDALAGAEAFAVQKLVADLRSPAAAVRAAAETRQTAVEAQLVAHSQALERAAARAEAADKKSALKDTQLRSAFDRENSLANELRNERLRFWVAVAGVVLLSLVALYVRLQLSGVGAALHLLPAGSVETVVAALDATVKGPARAMVRRGRERAASLAARLRFDAPSDAGSTPAAP